MLGSTWKSGLKRDWKKDQMFTMVRLQTDNGTSLSYKCDKLDKLVSKMGMKDMLEGKAWRRGPNLDYI